MGHIRLGTLPNSVPWHRVVELIAGDADVAAVASATTLAALKGLLRTESDDTFSQPFHALTELILSARDPNTAQAIRETSHHVVDAPDWVEIVANYSDTVDARLRGGTRSDLTEIAKLAGVESLTRVLNRKSSSLFETTPDDAQKSIRGLGTRSGFAALTHEYFTCFTQRFLTYHLGRELGLHVGGNGAFDNTRAHDQFVRQLNVHCREAAVITKRFGGDWCSKHQFLGDISQSKTRRFVNYCMKKLRSVLLSRRSRDG